MTSPRSATPLDEIIGANIIALRKQNSHTEKSLAERIGVSFQQVQKYERGMNRIPISRLLEIANLYGLKVDDFFTPMKTKIVKASGYEQR